MDPTQRVRLGSTPVEVTKIGIGTNPLGGMFEAIPRKAAMDTIQTAWDSDIRFFDVAPVYGYGFSERIVGEVLRPYPRDSYTLTTKVGRLLRPDGPPEREDTMVLYQGQQFYKDTEPVKPYFDFTYDGAMRSLEDSIKRTGIDRFDALHIHDPDWFMDEALDGAYRALADLKSQGVIGAIGCGVNAWETLVYMGQRADFDIFLLAGRYTLLDQSALAELLPLCVEKKVTLINGGVYNSGILSHPDPASIRGVDSDSEAMASWTDNVTYNYTPAGDEIIDKASRIKAVCDRYGVPLRAAAIQFPMHHPAVGCIVSGPRTAEHVTDNNAMFRWEIPAALWAELKGEGLLPEDAPTPAA